MKLPSLVEIVLALKQDVSSEKDWETVVDATIHAFGKLNILFNNAGITIRSGAWADIPVNDFQKILEVKSRVAEDRLLICPVDFQARHHLSTTF